jgi:hypothetical protein
MVDDEEISTEGVHPLILQFDFIELDILRRNVERSSRSIDRRTSLISLLRLSFQNPQLLIDGQSTLDRLFISSHFARRSAASESQ